MKFVTFTESGSTRIGLLKGDGVIDLSRADSALPTDMPGLLAAGAPAMAIAGKFQSANSDFDMNEIKLEAPILRPPKILAIGLNYRAHAVESKMDIPKVPLVFTKQSTSAQGPFDPIHWSEDSKALDYEGELGIVIGKRCRRVPKDKAAGVIAGFCIVNDVSVRDWQMRSKPPQFTMGKSWDTHCPFGPAMVTPDEVNPHELSLRTLVNGEVRQDSNTNDLIFDCYDIIEFLSTAFTLEPGDVIPTGTPSGVGSAMKPPAFLVVGDTVRVEIEGLGYIENKVIQEPDVTCY